MPARLVRLVLDRGILQQIPDKARTTPTAVTYVSKKQELSNLPCMAALNAACSKWVAVAPLANAPRTKQMH
eukprot:9006408-Pyramimonas_sp.AAC.1